MIIFGKNNKNLYKLRAYDVIGRIESTLSSYSFCWKRIILCICMPGQYDIPLLLPDTSFIKVYTFLLFNISCTKHFWVKYRTQFFRACNKFFCFGFNRKWWPVFRLLTFHFLETLSKSCKGNLLWKVNLS